MKHILMVVAVAALMVAMMVAMAAPAFAGEKENSCGTVSKVAKHPVGQTGHYKDCGVKNNPDYKNNKFPPGGGLTG
jgi:hypothetical protein